MTDVPTTQVSSPASCPCAAAWLTAGRYVVVVVMILEVLLGLKVSFAASIAQFYLLIRIFGLVVCLRGVFVDWFIFPKGQ